MNENFYQQNAKMTQPENYPVPSRDPQVITELNQVQDALDELSGLVSRMGSRLAPLMRDSDNTEKSGLKADEPLVPFAEMLRGKRYHVLQVVRAVNDMLQRLEI